MRTGLEALDHVPIGAPGLEQGVAWLAERTGVRAAMGGSHPGLVAARPSPLAAIRVELDTPRGPVVL